MDGWHDTILYESRVFVLYEYEFVWSIHTAFYGGKALCSLYIEKLGKLQKSSFPKTLTPPPLELSGNLFFRNFFLDLQKKFFFLSGPMAKMDRKGDGIVSILPMTWITEFYMNEN